LTKEENDALHSLKSRTDVIMKPANKSYDVVVINREDYISEASRQLSDARFYQKLDHDPTLEYAKIITNVIDEAYQSGHIDQQTKNYLSPENPRAGRFYLLLKIHKQGNPGRPIISGNGHPTERIIRIFRSFYETTCPQITIISSGHDILPHKKQSKQTITARYIACIFRRHIFVH
jgi:hypothetical protein